MNKLSIGLFTLLAAATVHAAPGDPAQVFAAAPLRFEPSGSGFVTRGLRFSSSIQGDHINLRSHDQAMRLTFAHANPDARLTPGTQLKSMTNVLRGNNPATWRTAVPNYATVSAGSLYPGVDLVYYGNHGDLEYDLIVKPGGNPRAIRLQLDGVTPSLDPQGNLSAAFIQKHPVAYQVAPDGSHLAVASRYRRNPDGTFGFAFGRYDHTRDLVIDPTLTFSAYVGGSSQDTAKGIGHDAASFIYVAGITLSTDFGLAGDSKQTANAGGYDVFVARFDPRASFDSQTVYTTYLGGSADDILSDMFVSPQGRVYLTGTTKSTDFPTVNPAQASLTGTSDAFLAVLDPSRPAGSALLYSTYYGGGTNVAAYGVTADSKGRAFIAGTTSSGDISIVNGFQPTMNGSNDGFVAGFDLTQTGSSSLIYSTFLGGSSWELCNAIAVAPDDTLWVGGETFSPDFPTAGNPYLNVNVANGDAFLAHLDPSKGGNSLVYGTYLAGSGFDSIQRLAVDAKGRVIASGYTTSTDFPVTSGAIQPAYKGASDAFVTILDSLATGNSPQLVYSTYFGGSGADMPTGIKLDANGLIYLTGFTASSDMSVTPGALGPQRAGGQDGFVLQLDPTATGSAGLLYSSFIATAASQIPYGIDVDSTGRIYVAGGTTGDLFAGVGSIRVSGTGNSDAFVMGFNPAK